ncbi:hypothetical protein [Streptomyces sp. NPDC095602]|uniref:hypothetical protein n=1 Tax=Streptomyces sp. NPDC095602 TaxID=3155819 RepID=UPI003322ED40
MIITACLLLPLMGVLLYGMDRFEDWLGGGTPDRRRHARPRHLRLIHGGARSAPASPGTGTGTGTGQKHRRAA